MRLLLQRTARLSLALFLPTAGLCAGLSVAGLGAASLGAVVLTGCATGVDVTDEQFEELTSAVEANASGSVAPTIANGSNADGSAAGSTNSSTNGSTSGSSGGNGTVNPNDIDGSNEVIPSDPLTGGSCNGAVAPIALGECAPEGAISILYTDRSDGQSDNQKITMNLSIQNSGGDFTLSDLVIRYWFTADGQRDFTAFTDYSSIGKDNVCIDFGDQLNSGFADIGFTVSDSINGDGVDEVQIRFNASNNGNLDQSNDFSFLANANRAPNENISAYLGGILVAGCEPQ